MVPNRQLLKLGVCLGGNGVNVAVHVACFQEPMLQRSQPPKDLYTDESKGISPPASSLDCKAAPVA